MMTEKPHVSHPTALGVKPVLWFHAFFSPLSSAYFFFWAHLQVTPVLLQNKSGCFVNSAACTGNGVFPQNSSNFSCIIKFPKTH